MTADTEGPGKPSEPSRESPRAKSTAPGPEPSAGAGLISLTIDPRSGRIVKMEAIDESGAHHELTREEKAALAKRNGKSSLEDVVERAFEAGISSVLYDDFEEHEPESEEDIQLRRLILRPMIERSPAGRLMKREVLHQAIVGTLIRETGGAREADADQSAASRRSPPPSGARRSAPKGRTQH